MRLISSFLMISVFCMSLGSVAQASSCRSALSSVASGLLVVSVCFSSGCAATEGPPKVEEVRF